MNFLLLGHRLFSLQGQGEDVIALIAAAQE
jgi:hypothetical protein